MKKYLFIIFLFACFSIRSQDEKEQLKIYSFQEVEKLHQQKSKPIMVFIYTDWCKICLGMKKNVFKNKTIVKKLNTDFYFIKLNAEEKKDITFFNKKFSYKPTGNNTGIHELAKELASLEGNISYPTTVFLNNNFEIILQINNYLSKQKLLSILKKIH